MISAGVAVVWEDVPRDAAYWEIEFHLSADKRQLVHTSNVTSILFRMERTAKPGGILVRGSDGLKALDEALLHFPHLQKVVLETLDLDESAKFASGMVQMVNANKIHRQTCAQSQKLALDNAPLDGNQVVVSPRWNSDGSLGHTDEFWSVEITYIAFHMRTGS